MSKKASPSLIGAFVVGAVVLAVLGAAVVGSGKLFAHAHYFIMYFDSDVNGLKVGAAVKFKGVEIGSVRHILLNVQSMTSAESYAKVSVPVIIEVDEKRLREKGLPADLDNRERMDEIIKSGLRAQLAMESFVTGLLYVKLDIEPNAPLNLVNDPDSEYQEIPTVPTPLEEVQSKLADFIEKFKDVDIPKLVKSITSIIDGVDEWVHSPQLKKTLESLDSSLIAFREAAQSLHKLGDDASGSVAPIRESLLQRSDELGATLRETRATISSMQGTIQPEAPLLYQINQTLADISDAARAIRTLADYLERHPDSVLRGKPAPRGD